MQRFFTFGFSLVVAALAANLLTQAAEPPALQDGNARVVLVGDSITGLSRNNSAGFAYQMEAALKAVYPASKPTIIALGGSGQGVGTWLGVEKNSRTTEGHLDVPGIGVKATLDQPANVLVIMLGMNDVLAPYVGSDPASLDGWVNRYQELINTLRQRLQPHVVGLATITMDTEDPVSAKNRLIDEMNRRVKVLAARLGCRLLPTAKTDRDVLEQGRTLNPSFHVTYDFVHPTEAGHIAIAIGMLEGLGEHKAATWLREQRLTKIWQVAIGLNPTFSYQIAPAVAPAGPDRQTFRIKYWWPEKEKAGTQAPRVKLAVPAGWQVSPRQLDGFHGDFLVTGTPDQIKNLFQLEGTAGAEKRRADVVIPAPWLVAAKLIQPSWDGVKFRADQSRTSIDEAITAGKDFTAPIDIGHGQTLTWQRFYPGVNYTGGDSPASVDYAAITHAANFEGGYGARWIHSERERPVKIELRTAIFAGDIYLTVWLNGEPVYAGSITAEPQRHKEVEARLHKGWNTLVFKANHRTWQWQVMVGLAPRDGDSLADLRYATTPH